jgi:hypothetical protein
MKFDKPQGREFELYFLIGYKFRELFINFKDWCGFLCKKKIRQNKAI